MARTHWPSAGELSSPTLYVRPAARRIRRGLHDGVRDVVHVAPGPPPLRETCVELEPVGPRIHARQVLAHAVTIVVARAEHRGQAQHRAREPGMGPGGALDGDLVVVPRDVSGAGRPPAPRERHLAKRRVLVQRHRFGGAGLHARQPVVRAVNVQAADDDQPLHAPGDGVGERTYVPLRERHEVDHHVRLRGPQRGRQLGEPRAVAAYPGDALREGARSLAAVDHGDLVPGGDEAAGRHAPDESGATDDQDAHLPSVREPAGCILGRMSPLERRPFLGLHVRATPARATPHPGGLYVSSVLEGSAAAAAGVKAGDFVTAIDGEALEDALHLLEVARSRRPGDVIAFRTVRDGASRDLQGVAPPLPAESGDAGTLQLGAVEARGHRLRTFVSVPPGPGPHPAVLYLQGLRGRSCESPLDPDASLRRLVDGWVRAGLLVLRVERSGVGDSEGPPCSRTDLDAELDGYLAGLDHLAARGDVDPRRVFLFGQSFGAMTGPLLALERAIAGIVVYGASGARWHDCVVDTSRRQRLLAGVPAAQVEAEVALWSELHGLVCREGWTPALAFERRPHLRALRSVDCVGETLWGRHASLYQQLDPLDLFSVWRDVGRAGTPVVVARGEFDWICTREEGEAIARAVGPTGRYEEIARTGHDWLSYESLEKSRRWGEGRWDGRVAERTAAWMLRP